MTFKEKVYNHCLHLVNEKAQLLQQVLADLKESGANETKSTAGDKHETALAMLQIEQANTREQLEKVVAQKAVLQKINPVITTVSIVNGSLVKTNQGYLFMSVALGRVKVENIEVIALSAQAPLGQKLTGLKAGDAATMNGINYSIENIV